MMTRDFASRWVLTTRWAIAEFIAQEMLTDDLGGSLRVDPERYLAECREWDKRVRVVEGK